MKILPDGLIELEGVGSDAALVVAMDEALRELYEWDQMPSIILLAIAKVRDDAYRFMPMLVLDGSPEETLAAILALTVSANDTRLPLPADWRRMGGTLHAVAIAAECWMVTTSNAAEAIQLNRASRRGEIHLMPSRREARFVILQPLDGERIELTRARGVGDMPDEFQAMPDADRSILDLLDAFAAAAMADNIPSMFRARKGHGK